MSAIERDFDRLAQLDEAGWTSNNQYHKFLLQHLPPECEHALEVGCGTGAFARALAGRAKRVTAIDLSAEMIRVARSRSTRYPQIEFATADIINSELPRDHFDCIASIATLHHLSQAEVLTKFKDAMRVGGKLLVLDLYQLETNLLTASGLSDNFLNLTAMGVTVVLRLIHNRYLRPPPAVRAAWETHLKTDHYLPMDEVCRLYESILPGVTIRRHLLWRYSAVWVKV